MRALLAAIALGSSLVAVQAHATTYNFDFTENSTDYTFSLDSSTATQPAGFGSVINKATNFANVMITDTATGASFTDMISVSPPGTASVTGDPSRTLTGTGGFGFSFNPVQATGVGTNIAFASGSTTGTDAANGGAGASLSISSAAVSAAPEPGTWALLLGGVGFLGAMMRLAHARRREDELKSLATA